MKEIKNKMIYGIIILIILFNILAITGNRVFATGVNNNVIYQKGRNTFNSCYRY